MQIKLPASLRWEGRRDVWKRKKLSLNAFNREVPRGYIFYCISISFIAPLAIPFGSVIKVCTTAPCLSETTTSRLRFLFPNGWRKRQRDMERVFSSQTSYHIDGSTDFGMRLQLTVKCILSPHRRSSRLLFLPFFSCKRLRVSVVVAWNTSFLGSQSFFRPWALLGESSSPSVAASCSIEWTWVLWVSDLFSSPLLLSKGCERDTKILQLELDIMPPDWLSLTCMSCD